MKLFLVRHGQSTLNKAKIHQTPTTPLSPKGIKQAKLVAEKLKGMRFDAILCSKYLRAVQTSEIINKALRKRIKYMQMLNEHKMPTEIGGLAANSKFVMAIHGQKRKHMHDPSWHYSDEENEFELRDRAIRFLNYARRMRKRSVLAITHGAFIDMIITVAIFGKETMPEDFFMIHQHFHAKNTGMTELEFTEAGIWRLRTFNDYSHLR